MEIARHWRLKEQRYRLVGEVCDNGHKVFPPRDVCPDCGQEAKKRFEFSGKGTVYSHTTIYEAPTGFDKNIPYVIAEVKLAEGPMILAQLTDLEMESKEEEIDGELRIVQTPKVEIDMEVEMVTRRLKEDGDNGLIIYGYKFRPPIGTSYPTEVSTSSK